MNPSQPTFEDADADDERAVGTEKLLQILKGLKHKVQKLHDEMAKCLVGQSLPGSSRELLTSSERATNREKKQ